MTTQYLQQSDVRVGDLAARELVYQQLGVLLGDRLPNLRKDDPIPTPSGKYLPSFRQLVQATKATGFPGPLQGGIDLLDAVFGGVEFMATDVEGMSLAIHIGGKSRCVPAPGYAAQMCNEMADDILAFRDRICTASGTTSVDWAEVGRNYRGMLFASSALVEAFLNRHLLAAQARGVDISSVETQSKFAERATAWMELFAPGKAASIKGSKYWCKQIELREERNAILHARSPSLGLSLRELPERLNAVRDGIGGLLCELQALTGSPLLRFMLRLRSAGEVTFTPRRASAPQGGHGSETGAVEGSHAAEDAVRP